jgi:hypothetical protein
MMAFDASLEEAFQSELLRLLRKEHALAVQGCPEEVLRGRVRMAVAKGRAMGLSWRSSLGAWVELMFEFGPNIDRHPAFRSLRLRRWREECAAEQEEDENQLIVSALARLSMEQLDDLRAFADVSLWSEAAGEPDGCQPCQC